jgi:hypothetical protein
MRIAAKCCCLLLAAVFPLLLGCQGSKDEPVDTGPEPAPAAHAEHGPHDGDLIELGEEEFHGELVHDDAAGKVTIYILDGAAVKDVPIDAKEVTINVTHEGTPTQFVLAAEPQETDGEGLSSRFSSTDKELAEHLDHEGDEASLAVTIMGKPYTGKIVHAH